jgi:lipopolysaccharide transport system permease protein
MSNGYPASKTPVETIIRPHGPGFDIRAIFKFRHLIWSMIHREVLTQFEELYFGFVFVVARPLLMAIIFVLFKHRSGAELGVDMPYIVYVYSGLALWFYFVEAATDTAGSIRKHANLLSKVYYPRLITPMATAAANLVSLLIAMIPLAVLMWYFGVTPGLNAVFLPLVILQTAVLAFSVGTIVASLSLRNRDWERFLAFVLYIGLFVSPVIYADTMLPESVRAYYNLNPMVGPLLALRASLSADIPFPLWQWSYSMALTFFLLASAVALYNRIEAKLADEL